MTIVKILQNIANKKLLQNLIKDGVVVIFCLKFLN